jgi:hypothetical protein
MFSNFRADYLNRFPGSNENEAERAFLFAVSMAVYGDVSTDDQERIDQIR